MPQPDAHGLALRLGRRARRVPRAVHVLELPDQPADDRPGDRVVAVVAAPLVVRPFTPGRHQRLETGTLRRQRPPHLLGQGLHLPQRVRETVLDRRGDRTGGPAVGSREGEPHRRRVLHRHTRPVSAQRPLERPVRRQAVVGHAPFDELGRRDSLPCGGRRQGRADLLAQGSVPDLRPQPPQGLQRGRIVDLGQRVDRRARELEVLGHVGPGTACPQGERAEVGHGRRSTRQCACPDEASGQISVVLVHEVVVVVVVGHPPVVRAARPAAQRLVLGQRPQDPGRQFAGRRRLHEGAAGPPPPLCGTRPGRNHEVLDELGQLGRGLRLGAVAQRGGPRGVRRDQSVGYERPVDARQQCAQPPAERSAQVRGRLTAHQPRVGEPQLGGEGTAAVGVELLGRVQGRPQRTGGPVADGGRGGAGQHHRDLLRAPAPHPRHHGDELGLVRP